MSLVTGKRHHYYISRGCICNARITPCLSYAESGRRNRGVSKGKGLWVGGKGGANVHRWLTLKKHANFGRNVLAAFLTVTPNIAFYFITQ